jgi:pyruvate,orthophosphate dikinase
MSSVPAERGAERCAAYPFDHPHLGSHDEVVRLIGGKGASLWAMTRLGIPTPPGFTIAAGECERFLKYGLDDALRRGIREQLARVEADLGRRFGDPANPLLLSVRSGAAVSMPGMMDTVLNVGFTRDVFEALHARPALRSFALDSYSRFLKMFGTIVLGIEFAAYDEAATVEACARRHDTIVAAVGERFDDAFAQLEMCVDAVFRSWYSPRAKFYRQHERLDEGAGTAVTIQAMVFGNRDAESGTGVVFSRDPSTGAPGACGDFMAVAQGEDVVAGTHRSRPLRELGETLPAVYESLCAAVDKLERYYRDMCDVEFTIESGRLWILQARPGKRSPRAAARIAVELAEDPRFELTRAGALARVPPELLSDGDAGERRIATSDAALGRGIGVSPGIAEGIAILDPDRAVARAEDGEPIILVRNETSPADIHGMGVSAGIVTALGGQMSHAALVAREWAIPAVCGVETLAVGADSFEIAGVTYPEGTRIAIDGRTGDVYLGSVETVAVAADPYVAVLKAWSREASPG